MIFSSFTGRSGLSRIGAIGFFQNRIENRSRSFPSKGQRASGYTGSPREFAKC